MAITFYDGNDPRCVCPALSKGNTYPYRHTRGGQPDRFTTGPCTYCRNQVQWQPAAECWATFGPLTVTEWP